MDAIKVKDNDNVFALKKSNNVNDRISIKKQNNSPMNSFFKVYFGSNFGLWGSFLKYFSIPGGSLGTLWAHFQCRKTAWNSKGVPRAAQEAPTPK